MEKKWNEIWNKIGTKWNWNKWKECDNDFDYDYDGFDGKNNDDTKSDDKMTILTTTIRWW